MAFMYFKRYDETLNKNKEKPSRNRKPYFLQYACMSGGEDNLTAVLHKVNEIKLENRPIPKPKDDEVLLKMASVGICGSDVHYYVHGRIAHFIVKEPMVIGHEASGTVVKVGSAVKNLKEGDRVAVEPGTPCRRCNFCKQGRYNLCPDMLFCSTPPVHGLLSRYYAHTADFCYKLPDNVDFEMGALVEPLSCGMRGCMRADVGVGSVVFVIGVGPIGLVVVLISRFMGAAKIICTDLKEDRLELAKKCGADCTLKVTKEDDLKSLAEEIEKMLGEKPDKVIDCAGFHETVHLAILVTRYGGRYVLIGAGEDEMTIPVVTGLMVKEIDMMGMFRFCNNYHQSLAMLSTGSVNVKQLITHRFKIEETKEAFETAKSGKGNPIKIMIKCNED